MKSRITKGSIVVLIVAVSLAAFCSESRAVTPDESRTHWGKLRVQGILIVPLGDNHVEGWNDCGSGWFDFLNFFSSIDAQTAGGVCASFEYVLKRRYGIEVSLAYWANIVKIYFATDETTIEGSPNFIMPVIGFNYHFLTDGKKDIYAGPIACLGVKGTGLGINVEVSKDIALGLKLGMDYYITKSWSLGANLSYLDFGEMDFSLLPTGLSGILCNNGLFGIGSMNFVSVTFGAGYRF